jgi:hypothetical protein
MDGNNLETHKFRGSGEVVQDAIERRGAGGVVRALTGEAAEKNRERMPAAIRCRADADPPAAERMPAAGDHVVAMPAGAGTNPSEEQLPQCWTLWIARTPRGSSALPESRARNGRGERER